MSVLIDREKCIGCGLCVKDCPNACLTMNEGRACVNDGACIQCGHCYAVCPGNAVSMPGLNCTDEPVRAMSELDSDTLLSAMRSRRTIRQFTDQPVEEEKLIKILQAGRYCPTGGNSQTVEFTILGSRQAEAEQICVDLFRTGQKIAAPFAEFLQRINITDHFFFKGAPLVIVVSARSAVDGALASSYMEIMAESLGLGVLYSGFFRACASFSAKLRKLIHLAPGKQVVTCMVIGYPAVKYQRIAPRKEMQVKVL
ncbi:MAG: nitroreductase family protein [Solobacterium sp.]|nr:nitroreductase family protein [Solobacterium sp.]MBR2793182.1 nitroreductase family protein [Solobacterium sp.]